MRLVKGFRIIDVPVGMGAVLHPLYIKEHNNPLGKYAIHSWECPNCAFVVISTFHSKYEVELMKVHMVSDSYFVGSLSIGIR